MKKVLLIMCITSFCFTLYSYEIYKTNIYPGAVNHWNTSYGYGTFHLNTMESESGSILIKRILNFNNSLTKYEYTYNGNGQLSEYKESFQINGDIKESGTYTYEYDEGKLKTVKLNSRDIYFPTPYFLRISSAGDELLFDYEYNSEGDIISILYNDANGTKYFFKNNLLISVESIGISENRLSASYNYFEDESLQRYNLTYEEGKGISRKKTRYEFIYDEEGLIEGYFFERSGQGQDYERISCIFEHITNDDQTVNTSFALNEKGEILRTAKYEYESPNKYEVQIYDDQNQLIVTYDVERN